SAPPPAATHPARRLRDAYEPVAMHAVWSRKTNETLASLGLNFLTGYVWGRASGLGEPAASVVVSSFAVFEPGLIATLYEEGRGKVGRSELVEARDEATTASLEAVVGAADVSGVVSALRRGIDAADGTGRPLFSGLASQPWPERPVGQLWRACDIIREHRGDTHVATCVAAGLDPVAMNILTELYLGLPLFAYSASRAWPTETLEATADQLRGAGLLEGDRLSKEGRRLREDIEARTDAGQRSVVGAIGSDLDDTVARLDAWSTACVEAKLFPPSIHKRAAG
ncbi:MAG: SCO6745 family protein, partial [Acidimicrobiia bacterium]